MSTSFGNSGNKYGMAARWVSYPRCLASYQISESTRHVSMAIQHTTKHGNMARRALRGLPVGPNGCMYGDERRVRRQRSPPHLDARQSWPHWRSGLGRLRIKSRPCILASPLSSCCTPHPKATARLPLQLVSPLKTGPTAHSVPAPPHQAKCEASRTCSIPKSSCPA